MVSFPFECDAQFARAFKPRVTAPSSKQYRGRHLSRTRWIPERADDGLRFSCSRTPSPSASATRLVPDLIQTPRLRCGWWLPGNETFRGYDPSRMLNEHSQRAYHDPPLAFPCCRRIALFWSREAGESFARSVALIGFRGRAYVSRHMKSESTSQT